MENHNPSFNCFSEKNIQLSFSNKPIFMSESILSFFPLMSSIDRYVLIRCFAGLLAIWVVLEVAFYILIEYAVIPGLQKFQKPVPVEPCPVQFVKKILDLLDSLESYNITRYVEGFFHFRKLETIHKDNLRSFLSWAMFGKSMNHLGTRETEQLDEICLHLDERYVELKNLNNGFNPEATHCSFTLEPISYIHRPLLLYIAAGISEICFNMFAFRLRGYRSLELGGLNYWIKQGSASLDPLPPVLIFHGISPGWSLYGLLIKYMESNRTVILIDFDSIKIKSMKFYMPTINQFVNTVGAILKRHHIEKVSLVGHSFGSILSGWLVARIPEQITHVTLIDPVSLLLAFPDVAYSFLYKTPQTFWEWVIYLGAAKEITVAHALHRNFCWHKNILWLEDVPNHIGVVVGIGSADEISDMNAVGEYVKKCSQYRKGLTNNNNNNNRNDDCDQKVAEITCVEWKDYHHGQVLVSSQKLSELISIVKSSEKLLSV
jgi:hypothetical protein